MNNSFKNVRLLNITLLVANNGTVMQIRERLYFKIKNIFEYLRNSNAVWQFNNLSPFNVAIFLQSIFLHLKSFLKGRFLSCAKLFNCLLVRKLTLNEVSDDEINANRPKYLNFWTKLKQEIKVKPFKLCKLTRFLKVSDFLKCNNNTYYLNTTNKKAYFYDITYFFKTVTI